MTKDEFIGRAADAFLSWQYRGKPEDATLDDTLSAVEAVTAVLEAVGAWPVTAYVAVLSGGACSYATETTTCENDNRHGLCTFCGARQVLREAGLL